MTDELSILKKLIEETKPQGISRKLKMKYPDVFKLVEKFRTDKQLDSIAESIFLIVHKMESKPVCPSLNDNCISSLRFKSLTEGYSKYCSKCFSQSIEYKEKIKKTNLNRYGVENAMQRPDIVAKIKNTTFEKYGVISTNQLESVKRKKKDTIRRNFGTDGLSHYSITEKKKKTHMKNCGSEWATRTEETQAKRRNTCIDKYGVDNVMHVSEIQNKVRKSLYSEEFINYVHLLIESRGYRLVSNYNHAHDNIILHCNKCNHDFEILWNTFQQGGGICPQCNPMHRGISFQEKEIVEYIKSLGISNIIENDRSIINPLELDIVIPDKKIAIEYCGLWCHSSGGNAPYLIDKMYHTNKLNNCIVKSYNLITIFEDEWVMNKDIVKSRLANLMGKSNILRKIRASKCNIEYINFATKSDFLKKYHLQGDKVSQINLGLFYNGELVSVMTFTQKSIGVYELDRFCNLKDTIIYGAASKLLKRFKQDYEWKTIISFADRRWSIGNVYYKLGFNLDYITQPNYWYWGKGIKGRKHRLNYSKKKLIMMKSYNSSLTEFQIMALEKYAWIYDCGNYKFVMNNN